ncbi:MAG: hypothetical protein ABJD97_06235 [Betaproteobacteria bacterium]
MRPVLHLGRLAFAVLSLCAAGATLAGEPLDKPADDWARFGRSIDPNTFLVGHPASPRWIVVHANHEHPAVVQARLAAQKAIDPNTFIVQPPVAVTWLEMSDAPWEVVAGR